MMSTYRRPGRTAGTVWLAFEAPGSWAERAVCAQKDPEVFFPGKGESREPARQICQGCAVQAECLEYALEHRIGFGVWGGLSAQERRMLQHLRSRPQTAARAALEAS